MDTSYILKAARSALYATLVVALVGIASYIVFEPVVSRSATEVFEVTQTITGEISFLASTSPVTMNGSIAGLTGGTSWGTTTSRVLTNNATGYSMTIQFASNTAMYRDGGDGQIPNYQYSTGTVNYPSGFASAAYGQFGFTVNASNTSEVSDIFTFSGTSCGSNNNGSFTVNTCWRGASSTNASFETTLINSSGATPSSGSTSTVQFRVVVPSSPSPAIPTGTYTATATLTATTNP